jgi:hypothetical protein
MIKKPEEPFSSMIITPAYHHPQIYVHSQTIACLHQFVSILQTFYRQNAQLAVIKLHLHDKEASISDILHSSYLYTPER